MQLGFLRYRRLEYHKEEYGNWRRGETRRLEELNHRWGAVFSFGLLSSHSSWRHLSSACPSSGLRLSCQWTVPYGNPCRRQLLPSPHYGNVHHCRKPSATTAVLTFPCTFPQWTTLRASMWWVMVFVFNHRVSHWHSSAPHLPTIAPLLPFPCLFPTGNENFQLPGSHNQVVLAICDDDSGRSSQKWMSPHWELISGNSSL